MIQITGAKKRFGPRLLFEGLDWQVDAKDRVGLVGANGSGKTTLLRLLAGQGSLDGGSIHTVKGTTAGYLPQEGLGLSGRTAFAECLSVFSELRGIERELELLTRKMAESDPTSQEYGQVAERFHSLEGQFLTQDGYAVEAKVGTVLTGLGFDRADWYRRTEEFSGGWQMRIVLAKLLLEQPNLLLLDEPTNHLDLEARNWLEEYLASYPNAFILVSHDRYFLDATVSEIVELWNQRLNFYSGNYSRFLVQRDERRSQLTAAYRNQREKIRQLETFINRFRYQATKAKQVQSRIKELEKIDKIELPPEDDESIHFSFPQPKPSGRVVADFQNVSKSYPGKQVFDGVNFLIERGDRIALVGPNGAGKSTLIKMLAGIEPVTRGEYKLGHNAEPDYFAQDQYKELDPGVRLIDDLGDVAPSRSQTELRSLLGSFLFRSEDAFKQIGVLSGGERNRYALARMLLHPSNFLLLDEPTNHLDLKAKEVLLAALQKFSGTVVYVSHDRYFIDNLATRVFEIGGGQIRAYLGTYKDYLWTKQSQAAAQAAGTPQQTPGPLAPSANQALSEPPQQQQPVKRLNPIRARQMEERCAAIEEEVTKLEVEIADYENDLANFTSSDETVRITALLTERRTEYEALLVEWEEVSHALQAGRT